MKILIIPAILFAIATALICYDFNVNGYNGTLTVIGAVFALLFVLSLPILTLLAKWRKKQ